MDCVTITGMQKNKKIKPVLKECLESMSSPNEFEELGRASSWRDFRSQSFTYVLNLMQIFLVLYTPRIKFRTCVQSYTWYDNSGRRMITYQTNHMAIFWLLMETAIRSTLLGDNAVEHALQCICTIYGDCETNRGHRGSRQE